MYGVYTCILGSLGGICIGKHTNNIPYIECLGMKVGREDMGKTLPKTNKSSRNEHVIKKDGWSNSTRRVLGNTIKYIDPLASNSFSDKLMTTQSGWQF